MTKKIIHPDLSIIDFADTNLSAFMQDGKAYREVTPQMIDRITSGELVVTEYHLNTPLLGNVIYLSPKSSSN